MSMAQKMRRELEGASSTRTMTSFGIRHTSSSRSTFYGMITWGEW
jgi:hypothetical protein